MLFSFIQCLSLLRIIFRWGYTILRSPSCYLSLLTLHTAYAEASIHIHCTLLTNDLRKAMTVSNTSFLHSSMMRMTAVSLCRVPPVSFCLLITSASALGSGLDLAKHTFICLQGVSSDTLLCQHMACPRVLNSSHAQMLIACSLAAVPPWKIQPGKIALETQPC